MAITEDGAKFVMAGHYFILVTKAPRLFWNNDKLEWTTREYEATVFVLGAGMESAGNVAQKSAPAEVMLEDVTDRVQKARGIGEGERAARRMRH